MNSDQKSNGNRLGSALRLEPLGRLPQNLILTSGVAAQVGVLILVSAVYLAAAKLGLSVAFLNASVSPVWPPTGVAIAAVLLFGYRVSPAIFTGALVANMVTGLAFGPAGGIALGNTLEALSAAYLVRRFVGLHNPFYRARDVLKFVVLAVLVSPMVAATIGNASLCLGGADAWANFGSLWLTWWIGDGVGALVVTPLILNWVDRSPAPWTPRRWIEGVLLLVSLTAAAMGLFREALPNNFINLSLGRLIVPFLLWAALRLGPRGVTTAIALYSGIAIWGTRMGLGPIVGQSPNDSLLLLQVSVASNGITFLVLAGLVAERRRAEQAVSFAASIVESTNDAVMGKDLNGTILSWNKGAERLYGYTAEEIIGNSVSKLMPAERAYELPYILERLKLGERIERYETERVKKDGQMVHVSLTISPITNPAGDVIAGSVIARNISTRKRAASRLAGNLAISRVLADSPALSDATPKILQTICETLGWEVGAMWAVETDAEVLRCLKVWHVPTATVEGFKSVTYGRTFEPGVGLPGRVWTSRKAAWIPDLSKDDNFPRAPMALAEGLRAAFAFPIMAGENVLAVMEFFSREIREPDHALLAMFETIGSQLGQFIERKRAEEGLRQREEQLRLALEAADMGNWDYDVQTGVVKWSSGLEQIHGIPPGRFGGTFDDYLKDTHPEDRQRVVESLMRAMKGGDEHDVEYRICRPDGSERWVQGKGVVIRDENGQPSRMSGVCMDVTERKRAERERETLLAREQHARAEAEAANRAKDDFLALVSHELRTPLNAIVGWIDMLMANEERDEALTARAFEVIKRNSGLQTRIIEDILDVSRIVTGKLQLDMRPVEMPAIINSTLAAVQLTAAQKKIQIRTVLNNRTDPMTGDPYRLQQIVWNLLSNAIKFTPEGGQVEIKLEQIGLNARITVSDNGVGIPAGFLPRIFDRFSQADSSTTRKQGGLGLGLAIVRHLVEMHGGTIEAHSAGENRGAVFIVTLPCTAARDELQLTVPSDDARLSREHIQNLNGVRVLIVDDDVDSREVIAALLALRGAEAKSAGTVREALEVLTSWKPDVLVSDIGMPEQDGYDLIRELRSRERRDGGQIPAIALTGYAGLEEGERAISSGYQMHLGKPVEPNNLVRIIASFGSTNGRDIPHDLSST